MDQQPGQGDWWCGGAWGQSQGLTAQQVAQIVVTYPGPHYVWGPGLAQWTPAEQVPAIAAALRSLGGATVADVPMGAGDTAPPPQGYHQEQGEHEDEGGGGLRLDRNRLMFFGLVGLLLLMLCGLGGGVLVSQLIKKPPPPTPTPTPTPEPTPEPTPPPPPPLPRVRAVTERPTDWNRVPIKDNRRRHGAGEASSELMEGNGTLHGAARIGDVKSSTAWCESASDDGLGEWVELWMDCGSWTAKGVTGLGIRAGYGAVESAWRQNNRVAEAELTLSVGGWEAWRGEVSFDDVPDQQFVQLPEVYRCKGGETIVARLGILSVYEGGSYTDTCVSTVAFYAPAR
jgi:hypothetical protein